MDPGMLERRYPTTDGLWEEIEYGEPDPVHLARLERHLDRIPPAEADYLFLYFFKGKRQDDIAAIFGRTQADVSYRLNRGIERIRFLESLPEVSEIEVEETLANLRSPTGEPLISEFNLRILLGMLRSTCQSAVARELGISQGKVRHRFVTSIGRIQAAVQEGILPRRFLSLFECVARNGNILKEIQYSRWAVPECMVS